MARVQWARHARPAVRGIETLKVILAYGDSQGRPARDD